MEINEATFNGALGEVLVECHEGWKGFVHAEKNNSILPNKKADILIFPHYMQPVVVESAFEGTPDIDGDAIARLGEKANNMLDIMTAVALEIPIEIRKLDDGKEIREWLAAGNKLRYAVYSLVKGENTTPPECGYDMRFPVGEKNGGYISGTVEDLAGLIELAATPDKKIKQIAEKIGKSVCAIGERMHDNLNPDIRSGIADKVGQPADIHAMRVAACVWLNALDLHSKLAAAGVKDNDGQAIPLLDDCRTRNDILKVWGRILEVDYNSVFDPAYNSLEKLPDISGGFSAQILEDLRGLVGDMNSVKLGAVSDISSDMFPTLATDRKTTAAYYTRREVAELLAGLAFNLLPEEYLHAKATDFACSSKKPAVKDGLKIADFACGTGTLLKAAYRQVRRRAVTKKGIDMVKLHGHYMKECLHGADIQPIAAHLTAAGLSGLDPSAKYDRSKVICASIAGGRAGSLDLLKQDAIESLFGEKNFDATDVGKKAKKQGKARDDFRAKQGSFDLCIMNPPYSRTRKGSRVFGVEGMNEEDRQQSLDKLGELLSDTFANKKAGMGSAFCALAHAKLKQGGVLATVLPASAASQGAWAGFRKRLVANYSDIIVVGMASHTFSSFSADTGMGEILVCARKGNGTGEITYVNLHNLPRDFVEANEIARTLRNVHNMETNGDLEIGGQVFATCVRLKHENGEAWGGAGARSFTVPSIAKKIISGELSVLSSQGGSFGIPVLAIQNHMEVGPTHHLIGHLQGNEKIGAFCFNATKGKHADFSLWEADADIQTRLICDPTHYGRVNKGKEAEAEKMREQKSTLFFARGLQLTSQALASAMTSSDAQCMGGSAWAALSFSDPDVYPAYCLWFNSIFGLLSLWQCAGRQQKGRLRMQIHDIGEFPCPAFSDKKSKAAKKAVTVAKANFQKLAKLRLKPCSYAWCDDKRKKIDTVVLQMLGLEKQFSEQDIQNLREEWCREPSVHGWNREIKKALKKDGLI